MSSLPDCTELRRWRWKSPRAFVLEAGTSTLSGPSATPADDPRIREAHPGG
jgi:hypothetical protein